MGKRFRGPRADPPVWCPTCEKHIDSWNWTSHLNGAPHAAKLRSKALGSLGGDQSAPECNCGGGRKAVIRTVRKEGPNNGREFYTCGRGQPHGCKFFHWADGPALSTAESSSSSGSSSTDTAKDSITFDVVVKKVDDGNAASGISSSSSSVSPNDASTGDAAPKFPKLKVEITARPVGMAGPAEVKWGWKKEFMDLYKARIPGRTWNGANKAWTCPMDSLGALFKLLDECEITQIASNTEETVEQLRERADGSGRTSGTQVSSSSQPFPANGVRVTLSLERSGAAIAVAMTPFNHTVVSILRNLTPVNRSFDWNKKLWAVRVEGVYDLLQQLVEDEDVLSGGPREEDLPKLNVILSQVSDEDERIRAQRAENQLSRDEQFEAALAEQKKLDAAAYCPEAKRRRVDNSFAGQGFGLSSFSRDSSSFAARGVGSSFVAQPSFSRPTCPKCGDRDDESGEHICRLFGKFQCQCGQCWTSARVWYYRSRDSYESQSCRRCGQESKPIEARPRDRSGAMCSNNQGAHQQSLCGMCRKLGYNCMALRGG